MADYTLKLLGVPCIRTSTGPVRLPRRQPLALLAVLALADGPRSRDELAFLLWADAPQDVARQRLRRTLSQLRQALGASTADLPVQTTADALTLDLDRCQVDVRDFLRLASGASGSSGSDAIRPAEEALACYDGLLLSGFALDEAPEFEQWLVSQRERLERIRHELLHTLVAAYTSNGRPGQAIAAAERLLALDPLREETHRALMRLYAATNQRAAALRQYELCMVALERELGVDPLPETRQLYESLLRGDVSPAGRAPVTAAPAAWRVRTSLAVPYVARGDELARLRMALTSGLAGHPTVACISGPARRRSAAAMSSRPPVRSICWPSAS